MRLNWRIRHAGLPAPTWTARVAAALALCLLTFALAGPGAGAQTASSDTTSCAGANATETQAFASLGDSNWYVPAPNGNFESGSKNWTLTPGASVQSGIDQGLLPSSTGNHGLVLAPLSAATTDTFCVTGTAPTMRLFARQASLLPSAIVVTVVATRPGSLPQVLTTPTLSFPGLWTAPSELFRLPWLGDGNTQVSITIASVGLGTVQLDDVYVDPIRQR